MGQARLPETLGTIQLSPDPVTNCLATNSVGDSRNKEEFTRSGGIHFGEENVQVGIQSPAQKFADAAALVRAHLVREPACLRTYFCDYDCNGAFGVSFLAECWCKERRQRTNGECDGKD